jgi:DNA-binding Lrp family transcriptional regulator
MCANRPFRPSPQRADGRKLTEPVVLIRPISLQKLAKAENSFDYVQVVGKFVRICCSRLQDRAKRRKRERRAVALSEQEWRLLRLAQANGRMSVADLAEAAGMSTSACWRMLRNFEETGVISGYQARIDRRKVGYDIDAFVVVQIDCHREADVREFESALAKHPEIVECVVLSGPADYQLRIVGKDMTSFSEFCREVVARLPHARELRTSFVLSEVKTFGGYDAPRAQVAPAAKKRPQSSQKPL